MSLLLYTIHCNNFPKNHCESFFLLFFLHLTLSVWFYVSSKRKRILYTYSIWKRCFVSFRLLLSYRTYTLNFIISDWVYNFRIHFLFKWQKLSDDCIHEMWIPMPFVIVMNLWIRILIFVNTFFIFIAFSSNRANSLCKMTMREQ